MTYLTSEETVALNVISRSKRESAKALRSLKGKAHTIGKAIRDRQVTRESNKADK